MTGARAAAYFGLALAVIFSPPGWDPVVYGLTLLFILSQLAMARVRIVELETGLDELRARVVELETRERRREWYAPGEH